MKPVQDVVKGDVVEVYGTRLTVKRVRHYTDVVVIWWTDGKTPSTVTKGQRMAVVS